MRRVAERNVDIIGDMRPATPTSEQYSVFRAYLDQRHRDGGMADMTVLDYAMMVEDSHVETRIVEYRQRDADSGFRGRGAGPMLAVALTDVLNDGLSMVYSFFEPAEEARSLGTFMILDHIARAKRMGLQYVYLGYWVRGSRKMDYKSRFLPQERLMSQGWLRIDELARQPVTKSNSSLTFSAITIIAVRTAKAVTQSGATSSPILRREAVNMTSGTIANGSCRLRIT